MTYRVYQDLTEPDRIKFTVFEWHKGKIAYDPNTQHILVRAKEEIDKKRQNRYYIYALDGSRKEYTDFFNSFLAKDDAVAMDLASRQKPYQYKEKKPKPEPTLDEIVKPDCKIRVKDVYFDCYAREYTLVHLEIDDKDAYSDVKEVRLPIKRALATLRKAIQAYRHSPLYKHIYHTSDDWSLTTSGDRWKLNKEVVFYFLDWFEFSAPLETLLQQAETKARARRKELDEEFEQQRQQERQRSGYRYGYGWDQFFGGLGGFGGRPSEATYNAALGTLGLTRDGLTADTVKKAYRRLALRHHPDVGGDAAKFREINDAYNLVLKEVERQEIA